MPKVPIKLISTLIVKQHRHPLPVCSKGQHDPSCKAYPGELICTKVIKSFNKVTGQVQFEALCTHWYQ